MSQGISTLTLIRLAAYLMLTGALVLFHIDMIPFAADDAYIHFRIARNWVESGAPFFNPGEPILATSAPAWTLVLGGMFLAFGTKIVAVAILNGLLLTAVVFTASRLVYEVARVATWFADLIAVLVVLPFLLDASLLLMEVPLALLAVSVGALLYVRDQPWSLTVFALGASVRPELALLAGLAFLNCLWQRPRTESIRRIGIALVAVSPIILFLLGYYRTVIPQTVQAKSLIYDLTGLQVVVRIIDAIPTLPFWDPTASGLLWCLGATIVAALFMPKLQWGDPTRRIVGLLAITSIGIPATYVSLGVMTFPWYSPVFLVPFSLVIILVIASGPSRWAEVASLLVLLLPTAGMATSTLHAAVSDSTRLRQPPFQDAARVHQYLAAGRELYRESPDATLVAAEIGGLGFTFRGPIHDAMGLVSPDALKHHPLPFPADRISGLFGAIPTDYVREVDPDLIVSLDIFVQSFLRSDLASRYRVTRWPVLPPSVAEPGLPAIFDAQHLLIFRRKEVDDL